MLATKYFLILYKVKHKKIPRTLRPLRKFSIPNKIHNIFNLLLTKKQAKNYKLNL